jgi:endo-1,4-beta-xylanase
MRQGIRRNTRGQTLAQRIGCVAVVVVLAGLVGNASSIRSATAVPSTPRAVTACDQPTCSLRDIASGAKVRVGTAVDASLLDTEFLDFNTGVTDHSYAKVLARQFNSLTTETQLKWTRVHPRPDHYDFGAADKLVAFAQKHHMQVRGHTLLWGTSVYGYPAGG